MIFLAIMLISRTCPMNCKGISFTNRPHKVRKRKSVKIGWHDSRKKARNKGSWRRRGDMNIHFLGTSSSEGWPALFCWCKDCWRARELGGANLRTRSSVHIDDVIKIDFPPDTLHHV